MEHRALGRTGVKVSPLCLGCMMFGGKTTPEDSYAMIDRAIDAGINFLDTANVYSRGNSEQVTGEALKRNGKRAQIVLATKVHGRMDDTDPNAAGSSRRHIIEQCEASLRRLQTDYIDLYQIHRPRSDTPIDETLRALDDLIRAGKVRYIGTSNFAAWQEIEALWAAHELGLNRPICSQPAYNLLDRRAERELLPMARSYGLAVIPWSPLAQGFLTGKYNRETAPTDGRLTAQAGVQETGNVETHHQARVFDLIDLLIDLAAAKGCTVSQLALAWCMQQAGVTAPIIGPRTSEQLQDNLAACTVTITAEDRRQLDAIIPPGQMLVHYNRVTTAPRARWL